jgi:hypothetical protein
MLINEYDYQSYLYSFSNFAVIKRLSDEGIDVKKLGLSSFMVHITESYFEDMLVILEKGLKAVFDISEVYDYQNSYEINEMYNDEIESISEFNIIVMDQHLTDFWRNHPQMKSEFMKLMRGNDFTFGFLPNEEGFILSFEYLEAFYEVMDNLITYKNIIIDSKIGRQ